MENTSCGCECSFVKSGFCKTDKECPFFVQTLWQKQGDPTPKLVSDCFPKKFAVEQNQLLHRFLCMQSVQEELRNKISSLETTISSLCDILVKGFSMNKEKTLNLSDKEQFKSIE